MNQKTKTKKTKAKAAVKTAEPKIILPDRHIIPISSTSNEGTSGEPPAPTAGTPLPSKPKVIVPINDISPAAPKKRGTPHKPTTAPELPAQDQDYEIPNLEAPIAPEESAPPENEQTPEDDKSTLEPPKDSEVS